ncbi:MAG: metal-sensitive transcriptional regulator [Thermodesulfovibrio sp.]|nr:metal-sensitive transcriptional regulator [Thermodesulfovibrio sp.]
MGEEKTKLFKRLKKIEGQIKGLQKMIHQDRSCEEIITQLSSISGALKGVGMMIIKIYLKECLQKGKSIEEIEREFQKIIKRFIVNL